MSWLVTNQAQMRAKILSGSPKKNAAWRSFSNMKFGSRPGFVSAYQATNTASSRPSCQTLRYFMAPAFCLRPPAAAGSP